MDHELLQKRQFYRRISEINNSAINTILSKTDANLSLVITDLFQKLDKLAIEEVQNFNDAYAIVANCKKHFVDMFISAENNKFNLLLEKAKVILYTEAKEHKYLVSQQSIILGEELTQNWILEKMEQLDQLLVLAKNEKDISNLLNLKLSLYKILDEA